MKKKCLSIFGITLLALLASCSSNITYKINNMPANLQYNNTNVNVECTFNNTDLIIKKTTSTALIIVFELNNNITQSFSSTIDNVDNPTLEDMQNATYKANYNGIILSQKGNLTSKNFYNEDYIYFSPCFIEDNVVVDPTQNNISSKYVKCQANEFNSFYNDDIYLYEIIIKKEGNYLDFPSDMQIINKGTTKIKKHGKYKLTLID